MKKILITGAAGFIGYHLAERLLTVALDEGVRVIGIDNMNDSYDVNLKRARLKNLLTFQNFRFIESDISDKNQLFAIVMFYKVDVIFNLAARAGVRSSISNPGPYFESNMLGFYNILEACKDSRNQKMNKTYKGIQHLIYASSSSVYGEKEEIPFRESVTTDKPVSIYAATKKCNEILAYSYSILYDIPCTGLRFFTVYGPYGRPDMAYYKFTNKIVNGETIELYNRGKMYRDFTYVDDIVTAIKYIIQKEPKRQEDGAKYKIYNIGNGSPETLEKFVNILEECLLEENVAKTLCKKKYIPKQKGDVYQTCANVDELWKDFSFRPSVSLKDGLTKFVKWYKEYYLL